MIALLVAADQSFAEVLVATEVSVTAFLTFIILSGMKSMKAAICAAEL